MTERRTVILQFTPEAVRDVLGINGRVLDARVDHFAAGTLELVVCSPEAAPVPEGSEPPYARDARDYMTSPQPAGNVGSHPDPTCPAHGTDRPHIGCPCNFPELRPIRPSPTEE